MIFFLLKSFFKMSVAFQHKEVSAREEIHSRFAKFLKIMEEVFMFLGLVPMWSGF